LPSINSGGSRLCRQPEQITLLDCYLAVKENALFGLPAQMPTPTCTVGKRITQTLDGLFQDAEQALEAQLVQTNLAQAVECTAPEHYRDAMGKIS